MPPDIKLEHPTTNKHDDLDASPHQQPRKVCRACGAVGVKNRCGACRQVYFCNRACQKAIWVAHRPECQQLIATANSNTGNESNESNETNKTNVGVSIPPTTVSDAADTSNAEETNNDQLYVTSAPPPADVPSTTLSPKEKKKAVVLVPEPVVLAVLPPVEHEDPVQGIPSASPSASSTKTSSKKKKHKKKKARSNSLHAPASAPMPQAQRLKNRSQSLSAKKHVVWGDVLAREFTRFPGGGSAVPYDGSWALGLGSPVADVQLGPVLEIEELRLHELEARAKDLTKSQRAKVRDGETRQFDYKSGVRNPLFGRLSERERRRLFSESELRHLHELEEQVAHRKRSLSSDLAAPKSPFLSPAGGSATGSPSAEPLSIADADFACVASEQLNEFAVIRDSRDDACGCSCGELLKKVTKMNVKKLHAFLSERRVKLPGSGHSKPELLALAKAIAMREQNCATSTDCECARNGVGCHANVCVGCAGDCHNPHSQYAYNKDHVLQYRKHVIAQWNAEHQEQQQSQATRKKEASCAAQHPPHDVGRAPICVV